MYNDKELMHDRGNNLILYIKNVVRSNLACKDQLITFYICYDAFPIIHECSHVILTMNPCKVQSFEYYLYVKMTIIVCPKVQI